MADSVDSGSELLSIDAVIGEPETRADYYSDYVGRKTFGNGDAMNLNVMQRTTSPITYFSYKDIHYVADQKENSGLTWTRTLSDPYCLAERIFWTDNKSGHTFIGFSKPQSWTEENKWNKSDDGVYTGYFSATDGIVDFSTVDADMTDGIDPIGSKLKAEDILLTYDTNKHPDIGGMTTTVHFRHALASLRVIVNIQGFSPNTTALDVQTTVSDLKVLNQPWKYKWTQKPSESPVKGVDIPGWGVSDNTGTSDGKVEIKTWQPRPAGEGTGVSRKFTFYSLIVPGVQDNFAVQYKVTYPLYLDPSQTQNKEYEAKLEGDIKFLPGHCTTVNINLNHEGEPIYIGAEYIDWETVENPDRSDLQKISNFLDVDSRVDTKTNKLLVTIADDKAATKDDATWLYYDVKKDEDGDVVLDQESGKPIPVLVDIYGNDGSEAHPYVIKTARQLLSFAFEVKGGDTYEISNGKATKSGTFAGRDFKGKHIVLDSDIYLQKSPTSTTFDIVWPGIGDADAKHPFNGTFSGGHRRIKFLNGSPLFYHIGEYGHVGHLILEEVHACTGNGVFVEKNEGLIGASMVGSRRFNTTNPGAFELSTSASVAGSFCGENSGYLLACYGNTLFNVTGTATTVGGLVGKNSGTMVSCYAAGAISKENADSKENANETLTKVYGVVGENSGTMSFCVFDQEISQRTPNTSSDWVTCQITVKNGKDGTGALAKTTLVMQQPEIVDNTTTPDVSLNGNLRSWIEYNANVSSLRKFFPAGTTDDQIRTHLNDIYYNYFVAAYPSIH